MKAIQ